VEERHLRRICRTEDIGLSRSALRWAERHGQWQRLERGVWAEGPDEPTTLDRARAAVLATGGVASHHLAGVLHRLDSVDLGGTWVTVPPTANGRRPYVRRSPLSADCVVTVCGLPCTHGPRTLADLATSLSDDVWEHALESALRRRLVSIEEVAGNRRVLERRPAGAPPTESLLETLMVQLIHTVPGLPEPIRQLWIEAARARLDLAWPQLGFFVELDGQHHKDQPVYDARRETAVVAATGWLCGRFTWTEVVYLPNATARRLAGLADQARRRPLPQPRSSSATR
jgi:hypothetical protein